MDKFGKGGRHRCGAYAGDTRVCENTLIPQDKKTRGKIGFSNHQIGGRGQFLLLVTDTAIRHASACMSIVNISNAHTAVHTHRC